MCTCLCCERECPRDEPNLRHVHCQHSSWASPQDTMKTSKNCTLESPRASLSNRNAQNWSMNCTTPQFSARRNQGPIVAHQRACQNVQHSDDEQNLSHKDVELVELLELELHHHRDAQKSTTTLVPVDVLVRAEQHLRARGQPSTCRRPHRPRSRRG